VSDVRLKNNNQMKTCLMLDCEETILCIGYYYYVYCRKHLNSDLNQKNGRHQEFEKRMIFCSMPGCRNEYYCKKLCRKHYLRQKRHGNPTTVKKPNRYSTNEERKAAKKKACRKSYNNRRAFLRNSPFPDEFELKDSCEVCGKTDRLEADHKLPITRGGTNNINNLQTLCKSCNCSKGNRIHDEWLLKLKAGTIGPPVIKNKRRWLESE
jgi:5-methylcytosine-specific restriction endonuclease McrA